MKQFVHRNGTSGQHENMMPPPTAVTPLEQVERMRREKKITNSNLQKGTQVEKDVLEKTASVRKVFKWEDIEPHRQEVPKKEKKMSCTDTKTDSKRHIETD